MADGIKRKGSLSFVTNSVKFAGIAPFLVVGTGSDRIQVINSN